ncbi:MAG: hypothetical protein M3237_18640 [Actinomycetota bacterium]|nr:hypothetical protein [Actinomycetota bacterium]
MFDRCTPCLLGAATLCAGLVLVGPTSSADGDPVQRDASTSSSVIELAGEDRVQLVPTGASGPTILQPLPRPDGTTPGLIVSTADRTTTVAATDSTAAPTVVSGAAPQQAMATRAAEDLVELRFEVIGRDGRPAVAHVNIFDVATGAVSAYRTLPGDPDRECAATSSSPAPCILVPPGAYSLMALVTTMPEDQPSTVRNLTIQNLSLVGDPEVSVAQDLTFTFDAREARKVQVRTPGDPTKVNDGGALELGYTRTAANGRSIVIAQRPSFMLDRSFYQQPTAPVSLGELQSRARLRLEAPDIGLSAPTAGALHPEYYDRVWFSDVSSQFPVYDGRDLLRVADVGHATAEDLAGRDLRGAVAVAERSDDVSVADQSNRAAAAGAELVAIYNDGPGDNGDPGASGTMLEVPTVRLTRAEGQELLDLRPPDLATVHGESVTPYVYDLVIEHDGRIPDDLTFTARRGADGNLSTQVREFHGQPTQDSTFSEAAFAWQPGDQFAISTLFPIRGGAQERPEYRVADPETSWNFATSTPETTYNALFPRQPVLRMQLSDPDRRSYVAGEVVRKPVGAAPITAGPNPVVPIERSGDRMRVYIAGFVDADGNHGAPYTDRSGMRTFLSITANGEVIGETTARPQGIAQLPAGDSRVSIAFTTDNPQSWNDLSTHTDTTWTFDSAAVPAGEAAVQPVIVADYDVDVDLRNRAHGRTFDLNLSYLDGTSASAIGDLTLEASYDDGQSWQKATVRQGADGHHGVVLPRGEGFVSLRLRAADDAGSQLSQEVIRAWYVD